MNDNQENQQNETTKLKLLERVQAEYAASPLHQQGFQPRNSDLSAEEQEKVTMAENRMYGIKYATNRYFERWLNTNYPMNVLLSVNHLAFDGLLRSNVVMSLILKYDENASQEDYDTITEEINNIYVTADNARLVRFLGNGYDIDTITLAECHWLLQLASYLNCVIPEFPGHMLSLLNNNTKLEEVIFQKPLAKGTEYEVALQQAAFHQYQHLEALLKRIS